MTLLHTAVPLLVSQVKPLALHARNVIHKQQHLELNVSQEVCQMIFCAAVILDFMGMGCNAQNAKNVISIQWYQLRVLVEKPRTQLFASVMLDIMDQVQSAQDVKQDTILHKVHKFNFSFNFDFDRLS